DIHQVSPSILILLSAFCPGEPDTTCQAFVGETVILPCNVTSSGELDLSNSKLYWQKESVLVHFFHNGADSLDYQDMNYHDRTSLFLDEVKHGNFSLQLSNVRLDDTAVYTFPLSCLEVFKEYEVKFWMDF
uniref:Ig-like domain-containing protein n=1 Tax=Nothoprocta perdicaria TaxID=30464 RepID=A0A8C6ZIB4_NOTPE